MADAVPVDLEVDETELDDAISVVSVGMDVGESVADGDSFEVTVERTKRLVSGSSVAVMDSSVGLG